MQTNFHSVSQVHWKCATGGLKAHKIHLPESGMRFKIQRLSLGPIGPGDGRPALQNFSSLEMCGVPNRSSQKARESVSHTAAIRRGLNQAEPTTNEPCISSNLPHSLPYPKRHLPVVTPALMSMRAIGRPRLQATGECEAEWGSFQEKIELLLEQTAHPCIGNASSTN